jgi:methionine-rich copper-binding protein CopC
MIRRVDITIALAALTLAAGCAGNGEGLDQNGRPTTGIASTTLTADFESIQANVFTPLCTTCHSGASAPYGLRLDATNSYALLVGVDSGEVPTLQRVQAGNPDASYLIQKLIGSAAVGDRMPYGGPYLPQSTIDVIRQWIANGAQRSATTTTMSLHVVTAPLPDAVIADARPQLVIGFNREVDANLVNVTTVMLSKADSDDPIAITMAVPNANASTLTVTPRSNLVSGTYRLTLRGTGGGALAGLDAQPLNAPGASTPGSDYMTTFSVTVQP